MLILRRKDINMALDPLKVQMMDKILSEDASRPSSLPSSPTSSPSSPVGTKDWGLLNWAIPANLAQDIGAGFRNFIEQPNLQKNIDIAQRQSEEAMKVQDPEARKQMLAQANQTFIPTGKTAQETGQQFTPEVQQNPLWRAATSAIQIASAPGNAKAILNIPKNIANIPQSVSNVSRTIKGAGEKLAETKVGSVLSKYGTLERTGTTMEKAAEKGADINWNKVADTAIEEAKNESEPVKKLLQKYIKMYEPPAITTGPTGPGGTITGSSKIGPPTMPSLQALKTRTSLGNKVYKEIKFGPFDLSQKLPEDEAKAVDILRRTLSNQLKTSAPDIQTPDKVYAFYKGVLRGDAPQWAKRIVVSTIAAKVASGPLRELIKPFIRN